MKVVGRIFLYSRKDRRKDVKTEFFVRCRRTYVLNNCIIKKDYLISGIIFHIDNMFTSIEN